MVKNEIYITLLSGAYEATLEEASTLSLIIDFIVFVYYLIDYCTYSRIVGPSGLAGVLNDIINQSITVEPGILALEFFTSFFAYKFGGNELRQGRTLTPQQVREMQKDFDFSTGQLSR